MRVPFLDLRKSYLEIEDKIEKKVISSIKSGRYIGGKEVNNFEIKYSKFCNSKYCVSTGNGLDALFLGLKALEIGKGDEVIVPSHTFIASWLAIYRTGAKIVPVDSNIDSFNIDPEKILNKITKKTKAIMPVHMYGQPCEMDKIIKISKKYNLKIIEDAAQAHGASFKGKSIGTIGDITAWSFYPAKNLGAFGDAGAITTNSYKIYKKVKSLCSYGSVKKYENELIGFNSRMDPIQAAVLNLKIEDLRVSNNKRKALAEIYLNELNKGKLILPEINEWSKHAWHLFCVRHKKRNSILRKLKEKNIETIIHYPIPPHLQKAFKKLNFKKNSFPITENISKSVFSLPLNPSLTEDQVYYVVKTLNSSL